MNISIRADSLKCTLKDWKTWFPKNHYFQNIKGYSLKIIDNSEFLNFQKRVGENKFPAITLTWYYQFARNLQLWYSFFNAHSMVYLRILGYLLKSRFGNGNGFWKWVFPGSNSFWEIRGSGNVGMGIWKWMPPSKNHQEDMFIILYYIVYTIPYNYNIYYFYYIYTILYDII